jgi:predicted phosphate transport protein (TIGR00153 family)
VALRFKPVDTAFYTLLTSSATQLVDGARLLAEMLGDGNDRQGIAARMRDAEHHADETTHEIIRRVNSTFVTPFDREDIYALASGLDDVMDFMEEAVDLTLLYEVESLPSELAEQVEVLQRCAELTAESMPRLQSMKDLEEYWIEINRLENAGDKSYRRILAKLFSGAYEALEVLKLKDIVDSLEAAIDAFEHVANIVEQIHVKES